MVRIAGMLGKSRGLLFFAKKSQVEKNRAFDTHEFLVILKKIGKRLMGKEGMRSIGLALSIISLVRFSCQFIIIRIARILHIRKFDSLLKEPLIISDL